MPKSLNEEQSHKAAPDQRYPVVWPDVQHVERVHRARDRLDQSMLKSLDRHQQGTR